MKKRLLLFAMAAMLLMSSAAMADAPPYSWVQGGWLTEDPNGDFVDSGDGWFVGAQYGLKNFHFFVDYEDISYDESISAWDVGAGWHGLFGEPGDLVAELGYINWSPDFEGADDENGLFGRVGIRWRILPLLELNGFLTYTEPSDDDFSDLYDDVFGKTEAKIGGVVYLGPIGLGLDLFATSETTGGRFLIRFAFDRK
jgi:opacity protein-like surface antigen